MKYLLSLLLNSIYLYIIYILFYIYIVDTTVDPVRDIEIINLELILADVAQVSFNNLLELAAVALSVISM